jgi:hypothetical protein
LCNNHITNHQATAPTITQLFALIFMQAADLYCPSVGDALVVPALATVVVPGVTAEIVHVPTPIFSTVITVPVGKATLASVGILNAIAVALFISINS